MENIYKILIVFSLPAAIILSLFIGPYPIPPGKVLQILFNALVCNPQLGSAASRIVLYYRLPRVLAAALIGIALSISGASLQCMMRNPLVSPYVLGITSGAALGAAVALAFLPLFIPVELVAMITAIVAYLIVVAIAWGWGRGSIISLVLSGIVVNALFSAGLSLAEYFAPNPDKVAAIVFWLMGDVGQAGQWPDIIRMALIIIPCSIVLVMARWRLNILSLGDDEARSLGANPVFERLFFASVAALITASAVSYAGIIGWVGLLVPHIVRLMVGSDSRQVIIYSFFLGGTYLVLADDLSRAMTSQVIPIGILTTIMGAPILIILLRRAGKVWR